ncbi:hypothetical protein [Actinokineospora iranica]|uniref:Uncharacterized protein n=1 Tax=Actinokineospora iranica TaxID=1271860 RepID=A0A1G6XG78_9PSEU|nr:hypothetical protein [Actinokineospora iranica]SDD76335.1 hypothetical protein SAMN05216174_11755 [Actinokineospora iranica]
MSEPRSEQQEDIDRGTARERVARDPGFTVVAHPNVEQSVEQSTADGLADGLVDDEATEIGRDTGAERPSGPEDRTVHIEES